MTEMIMFIIYVAGAVTGWIAHKIMKQEDGEDE